MKKSIIFFLIFIIYLSTSSEDEGEMVLIIEETDKLGNPLKNQDKIITSSKNLHSKSILIQNPSNINQKSLIRNPNPKISLKKVQQKPIVKIEYNKFLNNCKYKTKIKFLQFDMFNYTNEGKSEKKVKVKTQVKIEIIENFLNKEGNILINNKIIKDLELTSEELILQKNEKVYQGNYNYEFKSKNIYWKNSKGDKKYIEFTLNKVNSENDTKVLSHYIEGMESILKINQMDDPRFDVGNYELKNIPCDIKLPLIHLKKEKIKIKENTEVISKMFCRQTTKVTHYLDLVFKFDIDFVNKIHLDKGSEYFINFFNKHKGIYQKFQSFAHKSEISSK